jgi:hypothetical protein
LVDDVLLPAEYAELAIVCGAGIETVLKNGRLYAGRVVQVLEIRKVVAVADSRLPDAAGVHDRFDRAPHL